VSKAFTGVFGGSLTWKGPGLDDDMTLEDAVSSDDLLNFL